MIPITSKEHLVYFMQCGMLRLSKIDLRFLQNLYHLTLNKSNITTNQIKLFDKLTAKYCRQLIQHGLTQYKIQKLNWETSIIESSPTFTDAYISINDNTIDFKSPFNKKFLQALGKVPYNTFKWSPVRKVHCAKYSTAALKVIVDLATTYYSKIHYCDTTKNLLEQLNNYNNIKYWEPTLVSIKDNFFVVGINNESLGNIVHNMELSNKLTCLCELSKYGIKVDNKIINDDPLNKFASEFITNVDLNHIDVYIDYLRLIDCDAVFFGNKVSTIASLSSWRKQLFEKFLAVNIIVDHKVETELATRISKHKKPVLLTTPHNNHQGYSHFYKVLLVKNSIPITIL